MLNSALRGFDAPWFSLVWVVHKVAQPKRVKVHYIDLIKSWEQFIGISIFKVLLFAVCAF